MEREPYAPHHHPIGPVRHPAAETQAASDFMLLKRARTHMQPYWTSAMFALNLVLLIVVMVYAYISTKDTEKHLHNPVRFDVYSIYPYENWTGVDEFITKNVSDATMCANATDPACTTEASLVEWANIYMECNTTDKALRPAFCSRCMEEYAKRIYLYGLNDLAGAAVDITADEFKTLRKQMEGCVSRNTQWSSVKFLHQTNLWIHMLIWCTLMTAYYAQETVRCFLGHSTLAWVAFGLVLVAGYSCAINFAIYEDKDSEAGSTLKGDTSDFDLYVFLYQTIIGASLLIGAYHFYGSVDKFKKLEKADDPPVKKVRESLIFMYRLVFFDVVIVMAVPCMAIIMCGYSGLLDFDIIVNTVTSLCVVTAIATADDLLNVFWSHSQAKQDKGMHAQTHSLIILTVAFVLLYMVFMSVPNAPGLDVFQGHLQRGLFYFFIAIATVFPTLFHQFSARDSREIVFYKEGSEFLYRLLVLAIMFSIYNA